MNLLEVCLRIANSAVVLAAAKCFLHLTREMPHIHKQVFEIALEPCEQGFIAMDAGLRASTPSVSDIDDSAKF